MNSMLGLAASWSQFFENGAPAWAGEWLDSLLTILSDVLWVVLAITAAAGAVYAVYIGIKMARADSAEAREESKKRFINIVVAIVVVVVLIVVFNVFVPMILDAVTDYEDELATTDGASSLSTIVNTIRCIARV